MSVAIACRAGTVIVVAAAAAAAALATAAPAKADYGPGATYQIEISANGNYPAAVPAGQPSGGIWLWIELDPAYAGASYGTGEYRGSDCMHGTGASPDAGDVTWTSDGTTLTIQQVALNGLGGIAPAIEVPAAYGHYAYRTANPIGQVFLGLPFPGGFVQVQVAP